MTGGNSRQKENKVLDNNKIKVTQSDFSRMKMDKKGNDSRKSSVDASSNKLFNERGDVIDKSNTTAQINHK